MKVRDFCNRQVVTAEPLASLHEASILMRNNHVGTLIVTEKTDAGPMPKGILTDRDIVVAVIAVPGARPEGIRVGDVMSRHLAVAREDDGVFKAAQIMSERGVRRLPVLAKDGTLRGIVSADDIQRVVSAEMANLAAALQKSAQREAIEWKVLEGLSSSDENQ